MERQHGIVRIYHLYFIIPVSYTHLGGITCESDLEFEYEETLQKARAVLEALWEEE